MGGISGKDLAYRALASAIGGPVDLTTMAMRPFGYSVEKPVLGSEWIGQKMEQSGIVSNARDPLAEFAASIMAPSPGGLAAGLGKGAALLPLTVGMAKFGRVDDALKSFVAKYQSRDEVSKDFGSGSLKDICTEPGNCAMVSEQLVKHFKSLGVEAKTYTGYGAKNKSWLKSAGVAPNSEDDAHTVVKVGDEIIDLTFRQFDKTAPEVRVIPKSQFSKEWHTVE